MTLKAKFHILRIFTCYNLYLGDLSDLTLSNINIVVDILIAGVLISNIDLD